MSKNLNYPFFRVRGCFPEKIMYTIAFALFISLIQAQASPTVETKFHKNRIPHSTSFYNAALSTTNYDATKPIQITGKVTDDKGSPLPGATIKVQGKSTGTNTDDSGNFAIDASNGDILEISAVGYITQTVSINGTTVLTIQLQATNNEMDEVIVVGLGNKQKKISVVGALSTISTKELRQSPVANLTNALAGRLPGLITVQSSTKPGEGAELYIRGIGTSGPSKSPLIVIDGLPRNRADFAQLDANEIESVTILKDASSTALYGIQGANGVVVVTTRRGKITQKPEIGFTAQYALQQPLRLPDMMDTYNLALLANDREAGSAPIWTKEDLDTILAGSDPYKYPNVNWQEYLYKEFAPQRQYNVTFTGGSAFAKYFVSGSYANQGSLFDHEDENNYNHTSKFNRYNFRSNIDLQINERLLIQVDMAGRLEHKGEPGAGYERLFRSVWNILPNQTPIFNKDGSLGHGGRLLMPLDYDNPYGALNRSGYFDSYATIMNGTFAANQKLDFITKGLSTQLLYTFQSNTYKATGRTQNYDTYVYLGTDPAGKDSYRKAREASPLQTWGSANFTQNNYIDFRINYDREFGKHHVTAQVLGNRTLNVINEELPYAYQGLSNRATYAYDSKYFAEINVGYNGSENFPKGKRYGLFPSIAAGWLVTNEDFFNQDWISHLKIRGSYGLVGNDKVGGNRWLYITDYAPGGGTNFGVNPVWFGGYSENRVGNPNVTWEKSKKMNIGLDATLFNGIAKITFDIFRELRYNILLPAGRVPSYVGVWNLAPRNSGKVLNRGFEVELQLNKKIGNDFTIFSTVQLTYARNKVLDNDQPRPAYAYQTLSNIEIGYDLGYIALGLFNDVEEIEKSPKQTFAPAVPGDVKYLDLNRDNRIDAADRTAIQIQNIPRYVAGGSIGFSYKGLDISALFNGAWGATIYSNGYYGKQIWEKRWTPTNKEGAVLPRAKYSSNNWQKSTFWILDGDYIKLRNAEIGYTLPKSLLSRIKVNYARIYANGQNLIVWDKLLVKEQDPEAPITDTNSYPSQRILNFGIQIRL